MTLDPRDEADLRQAVELLENPSFVATVTSLLGKPIEGGLKKLPAKVQEQIHKVSEKALRKAVDLAAETLDGQKAGPPANRRHKVLATVTGAAGGFFGMMALAVELPISTTIILRSIADIARAEGEDLSSPETRMSCVSVFALGGRSASDDAAETGYFAVRAALSKLIADAAKQVSTKGGVGLLQRTVPGLSKLIASVLSRFTPVVGEKVAVQAVPVIGAAGGAIVNLAFIDHFQRMARGHFAVRRLERKYGELVVRVEYERIAEELRRKGVI